MSVQPNHPPPSQPEATPRFGSVRWLPLLVAALGCVILAIWWFRPPHMALVPRLPGTDRAPGTEGGGHSNAVESGKLIVGPGRVADLPGNWPSFRGPARTGISTEKVTLARSWEGSGLRELWGIDLGEGYAGPAVVGGRVYLVDYDRETRQDAIRCLSLADGQEIWRFAYPVAVKRNHGMTRTVPAVSDNFLVSMGPKCHVSCLNPKTGELRWGMDLVKQFGATVPPWYAGQCPLIDGDLVILAPGGKDVLLMGVELETGKVRWQTPNSKGWKMTHSSIVSMEFGGERMFVYCASLGVVGVSAKDGRLLWETTDWKISIATVPTPVPLELGQIFLSGGYNAGSALLQLEASGGQFLVKTVKRLDPEVFGATQQTPIFYNQYIYGIRADGQFACLDPEGKIRWTSGPTQTFNLGSYLLADGLFLALNDSGALSLIEATPEKFNRLAQAQVLKGRESWGPMAIAGTRLLARDLTRMVCLEIGAH